MYILQTFHNCSAWSRVGLLTGYPLTSYYPGSKITNGYPPGNKGKQEKLAEEEQEGHTKDERLPKLVFCIDCVRYVSCLYCVLFIVIGCVTTKFLQLDAYLGWLLLEMVCMLNI